MKLKRKKEYKNSVCYEAVRPSSIISFLRYLKNNNHLYSDIEISVDNIPAELTRDGLNDETNSDTDIDLSDDETNNDTDIDFQINSSTADNDVINKEVEEPITENHVSSCETSLIYEKAVDELVLSPCEGKKPILLYQDKYCEELSHPFLFPTGNFGYQVKRDVHLSPIKYFNQRLLNYTQKFASDSDYIFFAQIITQHLRIMSRINIAMKKVSGNLTAGDLRNNYDSTIKRLIQDQEAYKFLQEVKGCPAYW